MIDNENKPDPSLSTPLESENTSMQAQENKTVESVSSTPVVETRPEPSPQEMRFKTLRELKEKAERERDDLRRMVEAQKSSEQPKSTSPGLTIGNDELAEGKHLQALQHEIERLRTEVTEYKQYSTTATAEARLKASYPDIDKVVSKENLEILAVQEPEIYQSIMSTQDFYAKGVSAYKALKKFGVHIEDNYESERELVAKNANKPRPTTAVNPTQGDSPLSNAHAFANGLTEELKSQLYREMIEARRGY